VQGQARGSASGITGHDASPVGRAAELEALAAFLGAPWPRLLLVEGPAGIGKSTLLETAIASAPGRGVTPLVVRQTEAEWTVPHAALTSLFPTIGWGRSSRTWCRPAGSRSRSRCAAPRHLPARCSTRLRIQR
jgi:AAA ATPase domain